MIEMKTMIEGKSNTEMTGENVSGQRKIPAINPTVTILTK
jgi:hypothetical protein